MPSQPVGVGHCGGGILLAREAGGMVLDRATLGEATLFSAGLIISNAALVEQFLALTDGTAWRGMG